MLLKKILIVFVCFAATKGFALSLPDVQRETIILAGEELKLVLSEQLNSNRPSPLLVKIRQRKSKNKKVTAALLAFPFPCGIVGLHRIYLGSAPYVPIVYIATIGGGFGILPFIDFCVLLIDNSLEPYINNDKVFMWVD